MQDGGMNRQQMSAYNADEIDEEKTRQRRWRAQDIEGGGEGGRDNPTPALPSREGERDKAAFPIRQSWRIQKKGNAERKRGGDRGEEGTGEREEDKGMRKKRGRGRGRGEGNRRNTGENRKQEIENRTQETENRKSPHSTGERGILGTNHQNERRKNKKISKA